MTSQASAGWYPDPLGHHERRYWDGSSWTAHVADGVAVSQDPLAAATPGATPSGIPPTAGIEPAGAGTPAGGASWGPPTVAGAIASPEQGWRPDPLQHAELRWWDGQAWTSHVATGGQTFEDALGATAAPTSHLGDATVPMSAVPPSRYPGATPPTTQMPAMPPTTAVPVVPGGAGGPAGKNRKLLWGGAAAALVVGGVVVATQLGGDDGQTTTDDTTDVTTDVTVPLDTIADTAPNTTSSPTVIITVPPLTTTIAPATTLAATTVPASTSPVTTPPGGLDTSNWLPCSQPLGGWELLYPPQWYVYSVDGDPSYDCSAFGLVDMTGMTEEEVFQAASVYVGLMDGQTLDEYRATYIDGGEWEAPPAIESITVQDRPAYRYTAIMPASSEGGTRWGVTEYAIDLTNLSQPGVMYLEVIVALGPEYDEATAILDAMVATMTLPSG